MKINLHTEIALYTQIYTKVRRIINQTITIRVTFFEQKEPQTATSFEQNGGRTRTNHEHIRQKQKLTAKTEQALVSSKTRGMWYMPPVTPTSIAGQALIGMMQSVECFRPDDTGSLTLRVNRCTVGGKG